MSDEHKPPQSPGLKAWSGAIAIGIAGSIAIFGLFLLVMLANVMTADSGSETARQQASTLISYHIAAFTLAALSCWIGAFSWPMAVWRQKLRVIAAATLGLGAAVFVLGFFMM